MNGRERALATLHRQPVDSTPLDCWLAQKQFLEMLERDYGTREQFMDEFDLCLATGYVPYPNQFGHKFDVTELEGIQLDDPLDPKWVSFRDWNYDFMGYNVAQAVEQHKARRLVTAHTWGIVEGTSTFLGIENCWLNLGMEPERMMAFFDRYADWMCGLVDNLAAAGVDMINLSDDWGSNNTMLFSPRMWRRMIRPYAERIVQHARGRGLFVTLHSDGYIMQVMDDIVEMGYHMLHPIQESSGMDPATVKAQYGDKIVIYGSLDVVDGLRVYDGEVLEQYIADRFAVYAPGGNFIFNTGHMVQPDVQPQRVLFAYSVAKRLAQEYRTLPE